MIAGPNGAGKTTFAREYLPEIDLRLSSVALALRRIEARVRQGGHDVPRRDVLRRFKRGWENFQKAYRPMAES